MKIIDIPMPPSCRYMSDYDKLINDLLPIYGKFILNKTLTGCGGTSLFLNSGLMVVIISPRIQVLKNKHKQYPDSFLFHIPQCGDRPSAIKQKMEELNSYLHLHYGLTPFGQPPPAKILVTLDSVGKVLSVLESCSIIDKFLFVVDEFQCLMGDAIFKGTVDMNFLVNIDNRARRICYLSATPIPEIYLDYIPQLANLPYYKLQWDPAVIEEPTLKVRQMKKGENAVKLCTELIQKYRNNGYFERKIIQGNVVYSREACIFLNEVKSIIRIIEKNNLLPEEVTILCSESKSSELPKGFTIGGLCTDRNNPINKTFTFCTKASFEGVDFYSTNASTYIFIDGGKEWLSLDVAIDLSQILGRQRLDSNPFRHDATLYYKTVPNPVTEVEFRQKQSEMEQTTKERLDMYDASPEKSKKWLVDLHLKISPEEKFVSDYVDVIQENGQSTLGFNYLVMAAKWNQWYQRRYYYSNSHQLISGIQSALGIGRKPVEVRDFESWYNNASDKDKLAGYADFRNKYPQYDEWIFQNPFIDLRFHQWYATLGYSTLKRVNFKEDKVINIYNEYCVQDLIKTACINAFEVGKIYSLKDVKNMLQQIYDHAGFSGKTAKATDLGKYLCSPKVQRTDGQGNRLWYIEILG
jgi:hypothetical protein